MGSRNGPNVLEKKNVAYRYLGEETHSLSLPGLKQRFLSLLLIIKNPTTLPYKACKMHTYGIPSYTFQLSTAIIRECFS